MSLIITNIGHSKIENAIALNQQLNITEIAVGSGIGYTPNGDAIALQNEIYRNAINDSTINNEQAEFNLVIPASAGVMSIGEIGLFDIDGNLIAIEVFEQAINKTSTMEISHSVSINVANASDVVQVVIDPSQVLATRDYVGDEISIHNQAPDSHQDIRDSLTINQSNQLTQNGYQVLPSGLIVQWLYVSFTTGIATKALPLTFPNKHFFAYATQDSIDAPQGIVVGASATGLGEVTVSSTLQSDGFGVFCIGY